MKYEINLEETNPLLEGHLNLGGKNKNTSIEVASKYFIKNNEAWIPIMGEIHYVRVEEENWKKELRKMKAGGITVVSCYVIWIYHEEEEGVFDFSGNKNLHKFIALCKECNLEVLLRIGPWVHAEVRNGGFPDWLLKKDCQPRTNDVKYLKFVRKFYEEIYKQVKEFLFYEEGPIFGIQIENELVNRGEHILTLKNMAREIGLEVPIYTATGWDAQYGAEIPEREVVPVFGGYPEAPWQGHIEKLKPSSHYFFVSARNDSSIGNDLMVHEKGDDNVFHMKYEWYPFATCELGGGIQVTHHRRPVIKPEETAIIAFVKLGCGNNMPGYYMYHGGTNGIGRLSTLQESKETGYPNDLPIRNYDFQAPIGEFGQIRGQYRKLKLQHLFLQAFGKEFAKLDAYFQKERITDRYNLTDLRYSVRTDKEMGYVFVNNYQRLEELSAHTEVQFVVPYGEGEMVFPRKGITVSPSEYFCYPFGIVMDKIKLRYATAQLLWREKNTWFFFQPSSTEVVYVLEDHNIKAIDSETAPEHTEEGWEIKQIADKNQKIIIKEENGEEISIVTLSEEEAEHFYVLEEGVYIAKGDMYSIDGEVISYQLGNPDVSCWHWEEGRFKKEEKIAAEIKWEVPVLEKGEIKVEEKGRYERELFLGKERRIKEWQADLKEKTKEESEAAYLKINYVGDVLQIYAGDVLAADDFYKGEPYLVSVKYLKQFGDKIKIIISELKKGGIYFEEGEREGLDLRKIEWITEYNTKIKKKC